MPAFSYLCSPRTINRALMVVDYLAFQKEFVHRHPFKNLIELRGVPVPEEKSSTSAPDIAFYNKGIPYSLDLVDKLRQ